MDWVVLHSHPAVLKHLVDASKRVAKAGCQPGLDCMRHAVFTLETTQALSCMTQPMQWRPSGQIRDPQVNSLEAVSRNLLGKVRIHLKLLFKEVVQICALAKVANLNWFASSGP